MSPMLYRVFLASLTVFLMGLAVLGGHAARAQAESQVAPAASDPYLAQDVSVDISADSALDARKKAFAEARRKAYEQVAGNLVAEGDRASLVIPDDRVIASLVRDIEIKSEKMTSHRYVGTLDVRFTPGAVRRTLQLAAAPPEAGENAAAAPGETDAAQAAASSGMGEDYIYSPRRGGLTRTTQAANRVAAPAASAARSLLVLPWYGTMGRQTLWGQGNPWRAAWEEKTGLSRDKSIILPVGDVDDLRDYAPPQPLSRRGDVDSLLKRYGASEAILALAEPQDGGGALVSLYRFENAMPVPIGRFGVDAGAQDVLGEAVQKAAATLRALPPAKAQPVPTPVSVTSPGMISPAPVTAAPPAGGTYRTLARFSGLQEWVAMRNALARIPGLGVAGIRSISPSQANIELTYGGDYNTLNAALIQTGLQLAPLQAGVAAADNAPQFVLTMPRGY